MDQIHHEPSSETPAGMPSTVFSTPQLGHIGTLFENREHFIEHSKRIASSLGFHLASRGSYPKKLRQDICFACTVGRKKAKKSVAPQDSQPQLLEPIQAPCPVAVTGKWQVDEDGSLLEGGKFEITQSVVTHNHPPVHPPSPPQPGTAQSSANQSNKRRRQQKWVPRPDASVPIAANSSTNLNQLQSGLESDSAEYQNPNNQPHPPVHTLNRLGSVSPSSHLSSSLPPSSPSSTSHQPDYLPASTHLPAQPHTLEDSIMEPARYPHRPHPLSSAIEPPVSPTEAIQEPRPLPSLPRVGEIFQTWDDFRHYARQAAEARGFSLSQSQSKGSSGTIVLRCSRFKEPGTAGQKMAENGCEAFYKVMKAKNGQDGFEVVQAYDEHNHPYGLHIPYHNPGRAGASQANGGSAPRRKKAKSTHVPANPTEPNAAYTYESTAPSSIAAAATPPAAVSAAAPKPFLFDPYTGKPLRSSATPAPAPASSHQTTPSPPSNGSEVSARPIPRMQAAQITSICPPGRTVPGASVYAPPPYYNPSTVYAAPAYPDAKSGYQQQQQAVLQQQPSRAPSAAVKRAAASKPSGPPPLNVRFSAKAQTLIGDFLVTLSPALGPYGPHFAWLGIQSPVDLLEIENTAGSAELDYLFDELDTSGMGRTGEGMSEDEKLLVMRGLKKLRMMREKPGYVLPA